LLNFLILLDLLLIVKLLDLLGLGREDNIVWLVSERDLELSVSELLVKVLDDLLSELFEVFSGRVLNGDLEDLLSILSDSGSLSNDLSWIDQVVEDLVVD
jgi:hypothetical protein